MYASSSSRPLRSFVSPVASIAGTSTTLGWPKLEQSSKSSVCPSVPFISAASHVVVFLGVPSTVASLPVQRSTSAWTLTPGSSPTPAIATPIWSRIASFATSMSRCGTLSSVTPLTYSANVCPNAMRSGSARRLHLARERTGRLRDGIEPRAVVPQDLAALLVVERQPEELRRRLGERAVGVRVVTRDDEVVRAHLVDDLHSRLFV